MGVKRFYCEHAYMRSRPVYKTLKVDGKTTSLCEQCFKLINTPDEVLNPRLASERSNHS